MQKANLHYKYIIVISMFFITIMLASALAVHRVFMLGPFVEPGGILLFPLTYFISDIIAEVYGYKISRQILWYGLSCQFAFALMMSFVMHLPAAPFWHGQVAFDTVFGPLLAYCIATTIGMFIGDFCNIYIISKWKILLRGKWFWLRSLGSTSIGEGVFTIVALYSIFGELSAQHMALKLVFDAYILKLIYGCFLTIPATILVTILKKIENTNIYENGIGFNPFIKNGEMK